MSEKDPPVIRCQMCLQPITKDYQFKIVFYESNLEKKIFVCGSNCLRQWVDRELDKIHLETLGDVL